MTIRSLPLTAFCLAFALSVSACSKKGPPNAAADATATEELQRLSIDDLAAKMDEAKQGKLALFVYDNNQRERFDKSHIPGARWLKFDDVQAKDLPSDKEATLVFYCANEH